MSNWSGGVLTNVGRELQLKVEAGATLTFTKIKLGDGIESLEAVDDLTDLMSPKFVMGISSKSVANDVCKITGVLSSSSIATGFRAREWGLFAQDPDIGEILYMISIDNQPDWVPSGSDIGKLAVSYAMNVAVSNASSITARIDPAGLVTADMLAELIHETQYNKSYNVGDYAFTGYGLPAWAYLECIQEGISGTIELDLSNVVEGERINDGTVVWIVRNWHSIHQYLVEATGYGIVSGLQVKAQDTPNMTVSIEGGTVHMKNGTRIVIAAIAALTIAAADATNPRIDSIYVDGTGNVAYAQGTPAAAPVAPTLSTDAVKLADVNVAANQTSVTDENIVRNSEVLPRFYNTGIVNVKDFGADMTGINPSDTAIANAIAYIKSIVDDSTMQHSPVILYFPAGHIKISQPIDVDLAYFTIHGDNTWIHAQNLDGVTINITTTSYQFDNAMLWLGGFTCWGSRESGNIAVKLDTAPRLEIRHINITQYDEGIQFGKNCYMNSLHRCDIQQCNTGVNYMESTNAGERQVLSECTFFGNTVDINNDQAVLAVDNCSFDFSDLIYQSSYPKAPSFTGCNIEFTGTEPNAELLDGLKFKLTNNFPEGIVFEKCNFMIDNVTERTPKFKFLISSPLTMGNYGKILLKNCHIENMGYLYTALSSSKISAVKNSYVTNDMSIPDYIYYGDSLTGGDTIPSLSKYIQCINGSLSINDGNLEFTSTGGGNVYFMCPVLAKDLTIAKFSARFKVSSAVANWLRIDCDLATFDDNGNMVQIPDSNNSWKSLNLSDVNATVGSATGMITPSLPSVEISKFYNTNVPVYVRFFFRCTNFTSGQKLIIFNAGIQCY